MEKGVKEIGEWCAWEWECVHKWEGGGRRGGCLKHFVIILICSHLAAHPHHHNRHTPITPPPPPVSQWLNLSSVSNLPVNLRLTLSFLLILSPHPFLLPPPSSISSSISSSTPLPFFLLLFLGEWGTKEHWEVGLWCSQPGGNHTPWVS